MSWYLTWQDAVVAVLAVAGLVFALWLRRKAGSCARGCGRCPLEKEIGF